MKKYVLTAVVVAVVAGLCAGCANKKKRVGLDDEPLSGAGYGYGQGGVSPEDGFSGSGEYIGQDRPLSGRPVNAAGPRLPIPELKTVYFDYDSAFLRADAMEALDQNAAWLLANPGKIIEVEGHCDERGSEQYNLALGERRALSVREYLIERGVAGDRIFTRSYGELRPAVPNARGEHELQLNRRCEFKEIVQDTI